MPLCKAMIQLILLTLIDHQLLSFLLALFLFLIMVQTNVQSHKIPFLTFRCNLLHHVVQDKKLPIISPQLFIKFLFTVLLYCQFRLCITALQAAQASGKAHTPKVTRNQRLPPGGSWRRRRLRENALPRNDFCLTTSQAPSTTSWSPSLPEGGFCKVHLPDKLKFIPRPRYKI